MRKVTEKSVDDEVQARLTISTRGSTRQILARVRLVVSKVLLWFSEAIFVLDEGGALCVIIIQVREQLDANSGSKRR